MEQSISTTTKKEQYIKFSTSEDDSETIGTERVLKLVPSHDGTGVNLCVDVENHENNAINKRWYIGRILHTGELLLFRKNKAETGLKVDDNGVILTKIKPAAVEDGC